MIRKIRKTGMECDKNQIWFLEKAETIFNNLLGSDSSSDDEDVCGLPDCVKVSRSDSTLKCLLVFEISDLF